MVNDDDDGDDHDVNDDQDNRFGFDCCWSRLGWLRFINCSVIVGKSCPVMRAEHWHLSINWMGQFEMVQIAVIMQVFGIFYVTFKIRSKFIIMKMMCMPRPILSLPHTLSHIDPGRPGFISNWSHLAPPTGANQITFRWKNFSNSDWQLVRTGLKKSKTPTISFFVLHDDGMELRCEERNILWRCQRGARICVMVFIWSPFSF